VTEQTSLREQVRAWQKLGLRGQLRAAWKRLRGGELTPVRAALSVAVGLFIGVTPLYGLHLLLVMAVCLPLRLDVPVSYLAANISMPLISPLLGLIEVELGSFVRTGAWRALSIDVIKREGLRPFLGDVVVGVAVFAPSIALVGGSLTYAIARLGRRLRSKAS
jgi:uncharacterized protein (DUF2062 family)